MGLGFAGLDSGGETRNAQGDHYHNSKIINNSRKRDNC